MLFQDKIYQLFTPFFLKNTVFELTNFSEWGELLPAGDERAGAAHTVALACHLHVADNRLQKEVNHRQNFPSHWAHERHLYVANNRLQKEVNHRQNLASHWALASRLQQDVNHRQNLASHWALACHLHVADNRLQQDVNHRQN